MGMVYQALGSQVEVVEMLDQVIPAADKDVIKVFTRATRKVCRYRLETKVTAVEAGKAGLQLLLKLKTVRRALRNTMQCWSRSAARRMVR